LVESPQRSDLPELPSLGAPLFLEFGRLIDLRRGIDELLRLVDDLQAASPANLSSIAPTASLSVRTLASSASSRS